MAIRYTPDELKFLRDSPLVVKPTALPPSDQWMGPLVETARNTTRTPNERAKNQDSNPLLEQARRPAHISRNSANPEDIILGPPKTSFMSATSIRNTTKTFELPDRPILRESDSRDRHGFRTKGDLDGDRSKETRGNNLRPRRAEGDQDSDGWIPVKPRKSFGTEGAERFNGRMGVDRNKEERRFKERDEREVKEKPRGFESYSRDTRDHDVEQERDTRRNGTGRGRNETTWREREVKDKDADFPPANRDRNSNGERFSERTRGWREKERDDGDRMAPRFDRQERHWDKNRNQREEREPEWANEPMEKENPREHTQEDFLKWKEQMHLDKGGSKPTPEETRFKPDAGASFFGLEKAKVETPVETPPVDTSLNISAGPDKFFGMWATKEEVAKDFPSGPTTENVPRPKTASKSSRFTTFFAPQEEAPKQAEAPPPVPVQPSLGGLGALFQSSGNGNGDNSAQSAADKVAFQQLLQKLQQQTKAKSGSTPPANPVLQPKPPAEKVQIQPLSSPEAFQQYRSEQRDDGRPSTRSSQQSSMQDIFAQRQMTGSQPSIRPDQVLQDLVGQRSTTRSQTSNRPDQPQSQNNNTLFLMNLMQSAKAAPEPQLRMPPKSAERQMQQQMMEREQQEMARELRERAAAQRRPPPSGPPPGFFEDPAFQRAPPQERQGPPQPTQILQRPPPPGLDMGWDRPPLQHRTSQGLPPPPGLVGAPNRGMPMPQQQMFPPGFQVNNFPPQEAMAGPRMMQPPPGFFNGPPPGFMPPGMYQGPESLGGFGAPFDGRGPPPQGAFRRQ